MGPRPARCECRPRHEADAGSRNPYRMPEGPQCQYNTSSDPIQQKATAYDHTVPAAAFLFFLPSTAFFVDKGPACYYNNVVKMAQEIKMSAAGLKAMQEELEYLKTVRRKELAEEIKEARSHGDLSENSEYDEAKNTQGLVENRITELEQMIKNAVVIDESELSVDSVSVGTHVVIRMTGEDETEEYDIVGRTEADPLNGKISDESPVGHALLNKAVGAKTEVLLPTGHTVEYTVLRISHAAN